MVMNAWNSIADGGENLARYCVGPSGHLVGGDFRVALATEENNLISRLYFFYIGNIDHSQIHTYSSGYSCSLPANQDFAAIGKQPRVAVGITQRQCGDEALALCDERLAITNARTGSNSLQLENARFS